MVVRLSPEFGGVSSANSQAAQATSQNAVLQAKIAKLRKESDNTSALAAALKAARQALPVDTGLPDLIRQLSSQTKQAGTTLISITVSTPTVVSGSGAASTTTAAPAVPRRVWPPPPLLGSCS